MNTRYIEISPKPQYWPTLRKDLYWFTLFHFPTSSPGVNTLQEFWYSFDLDLEEILVEVMHLSAPTRKTWRFTKTQSTTISAGYATLWNMHVSYLVRIPCGTFPALSLRTNAWLICSRSADSLVFIIEVSIAAMSQGNQSRGMKKRICYAAGVQNIMSTLCPIL